MRFFLSIILLLNGYMISAYAHRLSADEALRRVEQNEKTMTHLRSLVRGRNAASLSHAASDGEYYVFDIAGGGYLIASGDDRAEALLAEIPNGKFNIEDIAPAAKWWLEEYSRQINWLRDNPDDLTANWESLSGVPDIATLYGKWKPIQPLMTCTWDQNYPYNNLCPTKGGRRCMTGCVATAMSMVIRTIGYAEGNGYKVDKNGDDPVEFTYTDHDFKFDIMPDKPSYTTATSEQIDAVAQLMLACGLSVNMKYSPSASSAYSSAVPEALKNNFGYGEYTDIYYREYLPVAKWESIIYEELSLGRPVYYSGNDRVTGHAFVIDGYQGGGMWHVNWGWGGQSNGYYRLSALTPGTQGIGGSISGNGYKYGQEIVKAVPPEGNPGFVPMTLSGSISVVGEGVYSVHYRSLGRQNPNVLLGAVIVDVNCNQVAKAAFWQRLTVGATGSVYMDNYSHDFSQYDVPAGDYRIYPAMVKENSDEFLITEEYAGRQHYINLSVDSDGRYHYSNIEASAESTSDIHISEIRENELRNYSSTITFSLVNNGKLDFKDNLTLGLAKAGTDQYVCSYSLPEITVPAGYNETVAWKIALCDSQNQILPVGRYRVMITDSNGNIIDRDKSFEVDVPEVRMTGWIAPQHLAIYNIDKSPSSLVVGEKWNHTINILNDEERKTKIELHFFKPGTATVIKSYIVYDGILSIKDGVMEIDSPEIDIPFGLYEVAYVESRSEISDRRTISICDSADGIYYMPLSREEVSVAAHPQSAYSGDIVIPATVDIEGQTYSVTSVGSGAFKESAELTSVDLPEQISYIGVNAFASCASLTHLIIRANDIPVSYRNHLAPGLTTETDIYVDHTMYDKWSEIMKDCNTVYSIVDMIESTNIEMTTPSAQATLALTPIHNGCNKGYTIEPAQFDPNPAAEMSIHSVEADKITLDIIARHAGVSEFNIIPDQPGLEAASVSVRIDDNVGINDIDPDSTDTETLIYDLQGRRIKNIDNRKGEIIIIVNGNGSKKQLMPVK